MYGFTIDRFKKGSWGKIVAFFDLKTKEGFILKGFKLVDSNNGLFVGFPSEKDKDGNYNDTIRADKALKQEVNHLAVSEYERETTAKESVGSSSSDEVNPFQ